MASDGERDQYLVGSVLRACEILRAFRDHRELLRLRDISGKTGLSAPTAFRLLQTLEAAGFVRRVGSRQYRSCIRDLERGKYRFGYASQGEDPTFSQEWGDSIKFVAAEEDIDLLVLDNGYDPDCALGNVDQFIRERVDLVIEHQFNDQIAPIISSKLHAANIPLIAMGTAHPGAVYFGGNNYVAGTIGGRYLGRWAKQHWRGGVDEIILLGLSIAGPLLASRLRGVEAGLREILPNLDSAKFVRLDGDGQFGGTMTLMRKHLRRTRARRLLIGAINDPCALGALRALEEAGWSDDCAVMGQGGSVEGRAELRRPGTHLVGTVAFFPERYGQSIIRLALHILSQVPTPPAVFARHELLTTTNVDHHYPNDILVNPPKI